MRSHAYAGVVAATSIRSGVHRPSLSGGQSTAHEVTMTTTSRKARKLMASPGRDAARPITSRPSGRGPELWNRFTGSGTTGRDVPADAAALRQGDCDRGRARRVPGDRGGERARLPHDRPRAIGLALARL